MASAAFDQIAKFAPPSVSVAPRVRGSAGSMTIEPCRDSRCALAYLALHLSICEPLEDVIYGFAIVHNPTDE